MMLNSSFSLAGAFQYNQRAVAKPAAGISVLRIFLVPEYSGNACAYHSMIAQAGASQKAPGSVLNSFINPDASRDSFSSLTTEAAKWLLSFLICARSTPAHTVGCCMYDSTPLSAEEILDHCRALAFAIVELDHALAKELLMYILWERLNLLNEALGKTEADDE